MKDYHKAARILVFTYGGLLFLAWLPVIIWPGEQFNAIFALFFTIPSTLLFDLWGIDTSLRSLFFGGLLNMALIYLIIWGLGKIASKSS